MTRALFQRRLLAMCAGLMAVALPSIAASQTPPRPNFTLRQDTRFWFGAWPGDFNRDGRTDLIAGRRGPTEHGEVPPDMVVALGRGDGTFGAARVLGIPAQPIGTGDFNGDSRLDVVISGSGGLAVLPGNGNGTFAALRTIAGDVTAPWPFAIIADFNNDGHRDVATGDGSNVVIFPGNGDFTFSAALTLPLGEFPAMEGISGDFNKDGRRDFAVVTFCCSVYVFLNRGGLLFDAHETAGLLELTDITTADLNRDGNLDLIVAASPEYGSPGSSSPSEIEVYLGNGDGTFDDYVAYDAGVRGPVTIVAADFNRDGLVDVATGNRSVHRDEDFGRQLWDSISVLPGDGAGRLRRGEIYALDTKNLRDDFVLTHNSLNTSDLNGDRHTDLIASPGVILLNRATAPNRRPSAFAGADRMTTDPEVFVLYGAGTDPDRHWLTYEWAAEGETLIFPAAPFIVIHNKPPGRYTYTLRVTDPYGATDTDSVTITVVAPGGPSVNMNWSGPPPSGPATLEWGASSSLRRFDLWWSANGGRSWGRIAECTALPANARSCMWNSPRDTVVRIVAFDRAGRQYIDLANDENVP